MQYYIILYKYIIIIILYSYCRGPHMYNIDSNLCDSDSFNRIDSKQLVRIISSIRIWVAHPLHVVRRIYIDGELWARLLPRHSDWWIGSNWLTDSNQFELMNWFESNSFDWLIRIMFEYILFIYMAVSLWFIYGIIPGPAVRFINCIM